MPRSSFRGPLSKVYSLRCTGPLTRPTRSTELRALKQNRGTRSSRAAQMGPQAEEVAGVLSGQALPSSASQHRIPTFNCSLNSDSRNIRCIEVCNSITHKPSPAGGELQQRSTPPYWHRSWWSSWRNPQPTPRQMKPAGLRYSLVFPLA